MSAIAQQEEAVTVESWRESNQVYLELELERLRLLVERRVLWLRSRWRHDPLAGFQSMVIEASPRSTCLTSSS